MIEDSVNLIVPAAPEDSETNERVTRTRDEFCVMGFDDIPLRNHFAKKVYVPTGAFK